MAKIKKDWQQEFCKDAEQGSANLLFKGPENTYFKLQGPYWFLSQLLNSAFVA